MARCCASQGARFTPVSPKPLKADSSRLPLASRAAAETKAAATQARSLIEQAEALGEPSEDHPLLLFSARVSSDKCVKLKNDFKVAGA